MSALSQRPADAVVGQPIPHESAALHVSGAALYTDDLVGRTRRCAPRLACPVTPRAGHGDSAPGRAGIRHRRSRPRAHGRRRARRQRRGRQGRRAALPERGLLRRPRGLLGPRREPRGGPARCWRPSRSTTRPPPRSSPSARRSPQRRSRAASPPSSEATSSAGSTARSGSSPASSTSPGRSTSTSRRTLRWRSSTRAVRSSCSRARSTRARPRRSSPTCWGCRATR